MHGCLLGVIVGVVVFVSYMVFAMLVVVGVALSFAFWTLGGFVTLFFASRAIIWRFVEALCSNMTFTATHFA